MLQRWHLRLWQLSGRVIKRNVYGQDGVCILSLLAHLLHNIFKLELRLDHRNRSRFNRFEVLDQRPLLDLVRQRLQVIYHVLTAVDAQTRHCDVHIAGLERKARHQRPEHLDGWCAAGERRIRHRLKLLEHVHSLVFIPLDRRLNLSGCLLNVFVKISVKLVFQLQKQRVLVGLHGTVRRQVL